MLLTVDEVFEVLDAKLVYAFLKNFTTCALMTVDSRLMIVYFILF